MSSIQNKKVIAEKIAMDLANFGGDVLNCIVDDFTQHGTFWLNVKFIDFRTNLGMIRPNLVRISRKIRAYLDKHPNVSLVGKKVTCPEAVYHKNFWRPSKKDFIGYDGQYISVKFTIVEDEEKIPVSLLTKK